MEDDSMEGATRTSRASRVRRRCRGGFGIRVLAAPVLAISLGLPTGLSAQQARSLEVTSFHSDIRIRPDGALDVLELIEVRFNGSWNGIFRSIPVEYRNDYGGNYTLRVDMQSIRDGSGRDLRYEVRREGRNRVFRIYVPGANDATRTVALSYVVHDGIRFFEEHDELYWNVTGTEWEVPILSASAHVELPPGATGIRATAYTGPYGSALQDARVTEGQGTLDFETEGPLPFRNGLTIVAGWDPGVVERPTFLDRLGHFLFSNFLLLIPIAAAGSMFLAWRRYGKDPDLGPLVPEYEPPEGLTPGEAGTIFDTSPDLRDVTATIVDLAVRGFLTIEETKKPMFLGLLTSDAFAFRIAAPRERWDPLKPHERLLLQALFEGRDDVNTADLENSFYKDLPGIKSKLSGLLVRDGHYLRDPRKVRVAFMVLGLVTGGLIGVAGAALLGQVLGQQPGVAIAAGILTALVIAVFGWFMPARTQKGTRTLARLKGFEEFLRRVESDRFERVVKTPEMFEQCLPYAMAFGVEKNWANAFDGIYRTPPQWYVGSNPVGFRANAFTGSLSRMAGVTGAAMTTAPRSSSGSSGFGGGGGGGFSGGGFGGGGGGGF